MKNFLKFVSICLISIVVSACGGGGESTPPAQTSGSISGTTVPGAIVGIVCFMSSGSACAGTAGTIIADSNGQYSFLGITQEGRYLVSASKAGYRSNSGNACNFAIGGFFNCVYNFPLVPLTPVAITTGLDAPQPMGFTFNESCSIGGSICGTGASTEIYASLYQWNLYRPYLSMTYNSTHDTLFIHKITSSEGVLRSDGVFCGVNSNVYVYDKWHYHCSDYFGITFNRVAGTISFDRTPVYHLTKGIDEFGVAYPHDPGSMSGTLTFAPF